MLAKVCWAAARSFEVLRREGPRVLARKVRYHLRRGGWRAAEQRDAQYKRWLERHRQTAPALARMAAQVAQFKSRRLITIVTPVHDPEESWLRKAIESVRAQVYPFWQLCLVDDGSTKPYVRPLLEEYAARDDRILVKHLPRGVGIAAASNEGLSMATGEFVGFLDHDDELSPDALFEVVRRLDAEPGLDVLYSDEDKLEVSGEPTTPFFKPGWSPDLLLSTNYINHFSIVRRQLLHQVGGFRLGFDGSQDHDLMLRVTERDARVGRIPKILYHWRKAAGSTAVAHAAKPAAQAAGQRAVEEALRRRGHTGAVASHRPGVYTVRYLIRGTPLVSIIIATRDRPMLLEQCLRSLEGRTGYRHYEVVVIDNGSVEPESLEYLDHVARRWRVLRYPGAFNFSAINNAGAAAARGDYLVFLNNDVQVASEDWLEAMVEHAQRPEVGAVGAKLLYHNGAIQHAGIILGIGGFTGHAFKGQFDGDPTYFDLAYQVRNCSAVTGACMMTRREVFAAAGGFDERLPVAYNDVDLCLRLRKTGYLVVYTPLAVLYHRESATRGRLQPPEDEALWLERWGDLVRRGDPYYNPNLTLLREDWSLDV